ncbi:MAG: hypothetical protein MUF01_02505 [Bryobacterales bacterium]|nr:hypothetical protein [Bryobacterales bacterium]
MRQNLTMPILHRFLLVFALVVLPCVAAGQTENDDVIKVETNLVTLPVIVSDRDNRYISRLAQMDFTLRMDGELQPIGYFAADEAPLNVAILLDTSRSTEPVLDKIKQAAREFIKQLKPADRAIQAGPGPAAPARRGVRLRLFAQGPGGDHEAYG